MLIDTHCHLHDPEFFSPEQAEKLLIEATKNNVKKVITIGTDLNDSLTAAIFAANHDNVYWTLGIHPSEHATPVPKGLKIGTHNHIDTENNLILTPETRKKLVAIGEIGLDYHYPPVNRDAQIKLFEQMLQLATDNNLPVSLHIREAFNDAYAVLDNFPEIKGVVHSFTGSKKELKKALERGFYIGVNGLATYSDINLPELDKIILETDAPFLTPKPFRDKINSPKYIATIATYLADKLGVAESFIEERTTKNAECLFDI